MTINVLNKEVNEIFEREGISGNLYAALSLQNELLDLLDSEEGTIEKWNKINDSLLYYKNYKLTEEEKWLLYMTDLPQWETIAADTITVIMANGRISYLIIEGLNTITETKDSAIIWKKKDYKEFLELAEKSKSCDIFYENEWGY